jgi:hypothetical protein
MGIRDICCHRCKYCLSNITPDVNALGSTEITVVVPAIGQQRLINEIVHARAVPAVRDPAQLSLDPAD